MAKTVVPMPAEAGLGVQIPGVTGVLPGAPGSYVLADKLPPHERTQLEKLGWKEGDPIPKSLPDMIEAAKRHGIGGPPDNWDPSSKFKEPKQLSLEDLDEATRARFEDEFARARKQFAADQQPPMPPGVSQAQKVAAAAEAQLDSDLEKSSDLKTENDGDNQEQASGLNLRPKFCLRCGFDCDRKEFAEPADEDKIGWLAATVAGENFSKTLSAFDGKVKMTFRTLTVKEQDAIVRIGVNDAKEQKLTNIQRVLAAAQLESCQLNGVAQDLERTGDVKSIDDYLRARSKHIYEDVLKSEILAGILDELSLAFAVIVSDLRGQARKKDFFHKADTPG